MNADEIDLLDRDRFTQGPPHDWFTWLRANAPVYHHPEPGGPGFWVITKHADVVACNRDAATFSSANDRGGVAILEGPTDAAPGTEMWGDMMLFMDPPAHTRYRGLISHGFTPRTVEALRSRIRELAVRYLDAAVARGVCDFAVDVAAELPLAVIAELLGVPPEDRHMVFGWTNRLIAADDPEYAVTPDERIEAAVSMFLYAQQLAGQRRAEPRDDIISSLLNAEIDGDRLGEMELNMFFLMLAVAGGDTTRHSLGQGMHALIEHPDQYALLAEDPDRYITGATEEILRWATPVMFFRRNTTRAVELRGQSIGTDEKISLWYISANRDDDVFDDPFRFDITRDPNPHVAFGGGGPHYCLGAQLARLQISVLFGELLQRVSCVEAVGPADWVRSNFVAGIKHLPVQLHR